MDYYRVYYIKAYEKNVTLTFDENYNLKTENYSKLFY